LRYAHDMTPHLPRFKRAVAALLAGVAFSLPAVAQDVDELLDRLRQPDTGDWKAVEQAIWQEWSRSGSPTADLLLERGREALKEDEVRAAVEHFTALVDHAPDFAEAYNARATAYFEAGLYGPALADLRRTLALNPRHFGAMTGLAVILEQLGQRREALSVYRAVAAIHPHHPDIRDGLERLERQLGEKSL